MDVGKQRQQAEHRHDLELQFLRLVRHLLRQGVQTQIKIADHQNGDDQEDADDHHQDIGVARRGDEAWQIMGGAWMKGFAHAILRSAVSSSSRVLSAYQYFKPRSNMARTNTCAALRQSAAADQ